MPDARGKLSAEEWNKAKQWVDDKGPSMLPCTVCGSKIWSIPDHLGSMRVLGRDRQIPILILCCDNCSNFRFFSAIKVGLAESDSGEERETPAD